MLILIEGIVMCFVLLIICVIGIANGPVGLVVFYEKDVQDRVVELGYTTKEKIKKANILSGIALFLPALFLVPFMVYGINGVSNMWNAFGQMVGIYMIMGLFDRIFIDWYWVGHTKTWEIKGTEDLKPYIPLKVVMGKWIGTLVMFPLYALFVSWIMTLIK